MKDFDGAFDLAIVGMAILSHETYRVVRVNPAMETMIGRSERALLGCDFVSLVHPDDRDGVAHLFVGAAGGGLHHHEARIVSADGSARVVALALAPVTARGLGGVARSGGGVGFLLCQAWDVDDQRRVENELRRGRRFLETALEATTDAVYMKDDDGRYMMVNRVTAAHMGCDPEAAIGRTDADVFGVEAAARLNAIDREVLASGETRTYEEAIVTAEGPHIFQSTKGVYRDSDGRSAGIFGISRDITDRRRAENERHRFQQTLELTVEGAAYLDPEGRFLWVNDAFARLCGYPPAAMVGRPWAVLLAHPDELDRMTAAHAALTEDGRIDMEFRSVRPDGTCFQAQLLMVAAKNADGLHAGFYSTLRDITDRKLAEEQLRQAAVELERRNGELEIFAALAAHELRQPLQVIGGFADLLADSEMGHRGEQSDRYLVAIGRGVETMTAMLESMLEFAQTGEAASPEGLTDSSAVVADVIEGLRGSTDGVRIVVEGRLPVLPADAGQLTSLFQNLIGNALKFRAGAAPLVQVAAERDRADWRFTVKDNGIGISPEFATRIFGMFERELRGEQSGTGMGLAICRKIVEHHGGRIWFAPAPGQGSIFSFTLPAEGAAGRAVSWPPV